MKIIKGFALNRAFIDNARDVVAGIGELDGVGFTYAKEPRVYSDSGYPTVSVVHFPSALSDVGVEDALPSTDSSQLLRVAQAVYNRTMSTTGVIAPGEFTQAVLGELGDDVQNVTVGGSVVYGNRSCVEWVSWEDARAPYAENQMRLWFSCDAFKGQFDEYDIEIVLPFDDPDRFFGDPVDVRTLLTSMTYNEEIERIQAARGNYQETVLWGKTFDYVPPSVSGMANVPAKFSALIYGAAGNNIDIIKEAIANKLLDGSEYTRDQWKAILPEIFMRTEFLVFPAWDRISIENLFEAQGVYSPVGVPTEDLQTVLDAGTDYPEDHVKTNLQACAFPFQSILLRIIGNEENRESKVKMTDWFPDYFFTSITSYDFSRMSVITQEWVKFINAMLLLAQDGSPQSSIPLGYTRAVRGNYTFLSKSYRDVNYLVAFKTQA